MPKSLGLMNPQHAAKSTMFKEGLVRIDSNSYKVHQGKAGEGQAELVPATKWSWKVTRLNEDREPITDEHGEEVTEELLFSFGTKCLPFVHPGKCDSIQDEDVEDLGTSVGTEGNTVFLVATDWAPHEKSGLMILTKSLAGLQVSNAYLDRCWAPDWDGCIFDMRSQAGEKGRDGNAFNYKVVHKVIVGPGGKAAKKAGPKVTDAEGYLAPMLHKLSQEWDGETVSFKAFVGRIKSAMDTAKTDAKLTIPILTLCRDPQWLQSHGETFDFYVDPAALTITFGKLPV